MGKILIIGVGSGGANAVKRMKEIGIPNADYITIGDYDVPYSDIPHYNLITLSGRDSIPAGASERIWKTVAEDAKDEIGEIIESYLNEE